MVAGTVPDKLYENTLAGESISHTVFISVCVKLRNKTSFTCIQGSLLGDRDRNS